MVQGSRYNNATKHWVILFGAFALALTFRLIRLGTLALNDLEAQLALQALSIAKGEPTLFGGVHSYVGLTGLPLFLWSKSNFLARFWPAFIGAFIVFIPLLFENYIGRKPALLAAFALAISPEMVGLSRLIGSPMMALVFTLLSVGLWLYRKPALAGISLALGLMSGPSFWVGVLVMGLSLFLSERLFNFFKIFPPAPDDNPARPMWGRLGIALVLTLVVVGSGFFMAPSGLSGIFSGLYDFIRGFQQVCLVPFGWPALALLAYGAGSVGFGLWGGIRGLLLKSKLEMFLLMWAGLGLVFITLYPQGGAGEIVWVTFPLWILASRVIIFAWRLPETSHLALGISAALVVVIAAFIALALRSLVAPTLPQSQQVNMLIAMAGGVVLIIAIILLINYGWSEVVALSGFLLGLGLVLLVGMVSVSVNSTGLATQMPFELWYPDEAVLLPEWTLVTIDRILDWNARGYKPIDILVSGIDTPGLRWALRSYDRVVFEPFVSPQSSPGILITPIGEIPENAHGYQGQSLVWQQKAPWHTLNPGDYLIWLFAREVPTVSQELILWVRTDLMPGGQIND